MFQIGVVRIALTTPLQRLREEYTSLYRHALCEHDLPNAIEMDVRPKPFSLRHRRRFDVRVNGSLQFEPARPAEIMPCVEWSINWQIPRVMPQYLQLHASSMEVNGQGVILPGPSGSGKSTLTAALLTRGWRYLCDEFALIHADSLMLHPYPRAICIKKPAYPVIESLGLKLHGSRYYLKGFKGYVGYLNPATIQPGTRGSLCPVRYVIFVQYRAGAKPALIPIHRAEAAFSLHKVCFNLLTCRSLGVDVIAAMIRGASCYRLISGDIYQTCDLVQELVEQQSAKARSA